MTRSEQHTMIQELRDHRSRMPQQDRDAFDMLWKRDRDDEDLDLIAQQKLEELHRKYVVRKTKKDIEALLKKFTAEQKKSDNLK